MLDPDQLTEIRDLLAKATSGPWTNIPNQGVVDRVGVPISNHRDRDLIVALVNAAPDLFAAAETVHDWPGPDAPIRRELEATIKQVAELQATVHRVEALADDLKAKGYGTSIYESAREVGELIEAALAQPPTEEADQ